MSEIVIRPALPRDVRSIAEVAAPYTANRVLISKDLIAYFEDVQEFLVAVDGDQLVGCGALHVFWDDIAEVRTIAVRDDYKKRGVGSRIVSALIQRARDLGLTRVFCLTFEVDFFAQFGFKEITGTPVGTDVYQQMLRSHDYGVAEFLDLARVKPNTLGNTRMLLDLTAEN